MGYNSMYFNLNPLVLYTQRSSDEHSLRSLERISCPCILPSRYSPLTASYQCDINENNILDTAKYMKSLGFLVSPPSLSATPRPDFHRMSDTTT